jgi:hypothetical protein
VACPPPQTSGFEELFEPPLLPHPARNAPVSTAAEAAAMTRRLIQEFTLAPWSQESTPGPVPAWKTQSVPPAIQPSRSTGRQPTIDHR